MACTILAAKPSVWFLSLDTDTITEQTIAYSQWPKAKSIASYASSLYLLDDTAVYKHVKNATGLLTQVRLPAASIQRSQQKHLSPGRGRIRLPASRQRACTAISAARSSNPPPSQTASPVPLTCASHQASAQIPSLQPGSNSKRIGLWTLKGQNLTFSKQLAPNNIKALYGADATTLRPATSTRSSTAGSSALLSSPKPCGTPTQQINSESPSLDAVQGNRVDEERKRC
jgi:hypothetical protein